MIHKLIKKYTLHQNYIQKVTSNIESVDNMRVLLDENQKCGYELMDIIQYYLADRIYYLSKLTNKPLWWLNKIPLSFAYDKISDPSVLTHTHTDISIIQHDSPIVLTYAMAYQSNGVIYFDDVEKMVKYKLMRMDV